MRQEFLLVEYGIVLPDVVDGTGELVGEHRESFSFAVLLYESVVELLSIRVMSQKPHGCLGECPLEVHVADLLASTATYLPSRFTGAPHEPRVRCQLLGTFEPIDVVDFVKDYKR